MNVILIGFRCAGKTTVGRKLAEKLSREFVDADERMEGKHGTTIRDIFLRKGESHFRLLESEVLAELAKLDGKIIATGGGAVLKYKNMKNLKRNGIIILLDVDAQNAYERLQQDPKSGLRRPPLSPKDLYTEIREQVEARRAYYHGVADFVIQTSQKPIEQVVSEVLSIIQKYEAQWES